nr:reverse transcriptase domain-containing protein [Tanacetum cinerariifolium]
SLGFDQPQPPQSPVIHQPPQELNIQDMEDLKQQYLDELKRLSERKPRKGQKSDQNRTKTGSNGREARDQALKIIENKSKVRYSRSKSNVSRVNMNSKDNVSKTDDRIDKLVDQISNLVEIVNKQVIALAKAVEKTCVTCGGAHAYYDCIATNSNQPSVCAATGSYNQPSTSGILSSNIVPNPKGEMKAITTCSGLAYEGPSIPTDSPLEKVDEQNTEEIMDKEHSNCPRSTAQVQSPVVLSRKYRSSPTSEMEVCYALANLEASINLMPLSIWKKLSLPELTPTRMTLELADRSITHPKRVAEDVFVKVGKFYFLTDFVVVDFEADPRVPLILGRSFLRTDRASIDVYGEKITLRVNDESVTFNLNQTMRYSSTYDDNSVNRVDVIDIACEDFVQDVLDFHYNPKSSNPTLVFDASIFESDSCKEPIVKSSSPTLTPFGENDFFLEEIKDFLNDDSIPTGIENSVYDLEGDILFLKKLLNEDPFQLSSMDLKLAEESKEKSSVEEPPELELKELPSHLEYAFLEGSNKLPISDIKGIDPRFCTHKILMEDDYKPAVQSQRRVNPKIYDVIKKEVIKLLDAGYFQIPIDLQDQEKPTFTCLYGTFAYRRMPFGLCNAPGHKISKSGIEVDRAKVDEIAKLPHPTTVKVDYLSKWVKVKALPTNDARVGVKFLKSLFSRFGIPRAIISDRGTHFCNDQFTRVMIKYGVTHRLATAYNPQRSGQVEVSNLGLKRILERTMGENRASWSDKLDDALWAFRTAYKTSIGCTPYKLVYGKSCHLPIELEHRAYWALKHVNFDLKTLGDHRKLQLNELSELRDQAYENSVIYKERTKKLHDSKIKNRIFNVGDQVLLFNSRLKIFSGKLKTHWSGPFTITQVFSYGTIELSQPNGPNFKVNGHRVKHYFGVTFLPMLSESSHVPHRQINSGIQSS